MSFSRQPFLALLPLPLLAPTRALSLHPLPSPLACSLPSHSGPPAACSPHAHGAGVAAQDQLATVAVKRAQLREELRQVNRKLESQIEARLSKEAAARCPCPLSVLILSLQMRADPRH